MSTIKKNGLNAKQFLFCQLYATDKECFGNGLRAYCKAYNIDDDSRTSVESARRCASKLLTNIDIIDQITLFLDKSDLNDEYVDKQLKFLIDQYADFTNKLGAIKEYNKLRQRIIEKHEIEVWDLPVGDGPVRQYDNA